MQARLPLADGAPLVSATFISRPNQLIIEARLDGRTVRAQMADRGRFAEVLRPGLRLLLAPRNEIGRKTEYQVVGVYDGEELFSLDTQLPQRLVAAALENSALPQFARYVHFQPDCTIGTHHFDFRLGEGLLTCILEVTAVNAISNGVALFPEVPSERVRKQLDALAQLARSGQRTAMLFIIQRSYARYLVPNESVDPLFARSLRQALAVGVEIYANLCPLTPAGITLGPPVAVFGSPATMTLDTVPALRGTQRR